MAGSIELQGGSMLLRSVLTSGLTRAQIGTQNEFAEQKEPIREGGLHVNHDHWHLINWFNA